MSSNRFYFFSATLLAFFAAFSIVRTPAKNVQNWCVSDAFDLAKSRVVDTPTDGGIRELVGERYRARYEKWKTEFIATRFGREQWDAYAADKNFILTIKISADENQGAGTTDYLWDKSGKLVGATIILGTNISRGFPDPIYFPVVNSVSAGGFSTRSSENVLAAAKIAHEFGHIKLTAQTGAEAFREQNRLMVEYNDIFRAAGYRPTDARLADLQEKLGGTPVEVWANREYWGETNAMNYLLERVGREDYYCSVVNRIERNVRSFAAEYEDRFLKIIETSDTCRD